MGMTQTEKLGFGKNVLELIEKESEVLAAAGYDSKKIHAILLGKYERAAEANSRQEEWKRRSKQSTEETVALTDDLYRSASGVLDSAIAAAGKGSAAAKNFQRLRSRVRDADSGVATTTVEPVTEAPR